MGTEKMLQKHLAAMEASMDGMAILDQRGKYLYLNDAHAKVYGYDGPEELMGKTWKVLYTDEEIKRFEREIMPVLWEKGQWRGEATGKRKDGSLYPQEISLTVIEGGGLVCVVRDITLRKLAEKNLKLFSEAVEEAPDGVQIVDLNGHILYSNKAVEYIYGFSREELKGKHVNDMNADPEFAVNVILPAIKKEGRWDGELMVKHKGGRIFPIWLTASMVKDDRGGPIAMVGIIRDITDLKQAQVLLKAAIAKTKEERAKTEAIIAAMGDGISIQDANFKILYQNQAHKDLAGDHAGEYCYRAYGRRESICEGCPIALSFKDGRIHRLEKSNSSNRGFVHIDISASPLRDAEGKIIAGIEIVRDITERKQFLEKLAQKTEELERSNEELDRFAWIVSHDLKEPLVSMGGFAETLRQRCKDKHDADGQKFISHIISGTLRMELLIGDLLTYARVTTRARPFAPVNCNTVLGVVLSNLRTAIEKSDTVITFDDLPTVTGDETQFVQVLQNLIDNAIKYRSDRPPRIHVSAKPIEEYMEQADRVGVKHGNTDFGELSRAVASVQNFGMKTGWLISVSDNGIGIAPQHHEQIFQIFQHLHPGDKYPGTGIGLAICKKIVERHGGSIWVESDPGKGSTFYFTIP